MAKIDVTKIEGFREDMTADEKLALLQNYEIAEPDYRGYISKDKFDQTASEAAKYKKELAARMSEEEKKAAKDAEERAALEEKYNAINQEVQIAKNKAKLLALGYDEKLADDTATAMASGDTEKVFANQAAFKVGIEKATEARLLNSTPRPPAGSSTPTAVTVEQFGKMGYQQRVELKTKDPETYKTLIQEETKNG